MTRRIIQLDLLRLLAVVLVLGRHIQLPGPETGWLYRFTTIWFRGGWVGVDIFFVLSGFLVSGLLFKEYFATGHISVANFLIRRGFKIYPAFYVLILITLPLTVLLGDPLRTKWILGEFLFLQNYLGGIWNHTWSLAVEEHFYLLLVGLLWYLTRRPSRSGGDSLAALPRIVFWTAFTCLCLRFLVAFYLPYSHMTHLFPTHLRIDSLLFGVLLAYYFHNREITARIPFMKHPALMVGLGVLCLLPAFLVYLESTWWMPVFGFVLFYIGGGCLLLGSLGFSVRSGGILDAISKIGAYSYSIYLWHMPVNTWGVKLATTLLGRSLAWGEYAALYLIGSIIIGIVMARLIEYPFLQIRDRLYPSGAAKANIKKATS